MSNDFFDLTEKQMSQLTSDEVKEFVAYHLMVKGVPQPVEPVYWDIEEPDIPSRVMYKVEFTEEDGWVSTSPDVLFDSQEEAMKAGELFCKSGKISTSEYLNGSSYKYTKGPAHMKVVTVPVYTKKDIDESRSLLNQADLKRKQNEEAKRMYNRALEEADKATSDIWDAHSVACSKALDMDRIKATHTTYNELASDPETALLFLENTYGKDKVADYLEWENEDDN